MFACTQIPTLDLTTKRVANLYMLVVAYYLAMWTDLIKLYFCLRFGSSFLLRNTAVGCCCSYTSNINCLPGCAYFCLFFILDVLNLENDQPQE